MSRATNGDSPTGNGQAPSGSPDALTRDAMLEVFSNKRRRFTMHALKQKDEGMTTVSDLAEQVAAWEYGKPIEQLSHRERKRVLNALRQFHLPKMEDNGFVKYDNQRGQIELTEMAANTNFYVDALTGRDVPWGVYYLGFSGLSVVCLAGLWLQLFPFTAVPTVAYGAFFVTALVVSSLGHAYDNYYRMRLGTKDRPPEAEDR